MIRQKLLIQKLFILAFALYITPVFAQDIKSDFLERMKMVNAETSSIESDFVQERTLSIMEDVLISSGKFYYKKPGLMKWDQLLPSPYYFIVNGNKVIRFDGKKRKVIPASSPQVSHFKDFILGTVNGTMFESKEFLSTFSRIDDEVTVILLPQQREMKKRIEKIQLIFAYDKMVLMELIIFEKGGDSTAIYFSDQKFNSISDSSIFN